jgi:hypothetical protein
VGSAAIAGGVLGPGMDEWVAIIVSEIPERSGFDRLVAANALSQAGSDEGFEKFAGQLVTRYSVALRMAQSLAISSDPPALR